MEVDKSNNVEKITEEKKTPVDEHVDDNKKVDQVDDKKSTDNGDKNEESKEDDKKPVDASPELLEKIKNQIEVIIIINNLIIFNITYILDIQFFMSVNLTDEKFEF